MLMISDYRYDNLHKVRYYLGTVIYPVYYIANLPVRISDWVHQKFIERNQLIRENEALKENNLFLNSELHRLDVLKNENKRLNNLLKSSYREIKNDTVVAKLIAINYTPFRQQIVLNKGGQNDAYIGQPILDSKGVIGQIIETTPFSATGMLISDPSHAMLAQVTRSGLRVLAVGTGNLQQLKLEYVPFDADIREGDTLVTSGLDGRYPPDYPIGKILRVTKDPGDSFSTITIKPFAKLGSHREVLLVLKTNKALQQ